jgi:transketolase
VLTHDSIGLGEDGPTHQPVEQMAALRAIPNLVMFRPADATETAECWQVALEAKHHPSGIALTRQNLIAARTTYSEENLCAKGAYVLSDADNAKATIFASGSEVEIALKAKELLAAKGVAARVVSVPSTELFEQQSDAYRASVIGNAKVKIAVEAAIRQGWDAIIGSDGGFVGMKSFGASAPYKQLYEHFGITPEAVADLATKMLA